MRAVDHRIQMESLVAIVSGGVRVSGDFDELDGHVVNRRRAGVFLASERGDGHSGSVYHRYIGAVVVVDLKPVSRTAGRKGFGLVSSAIVVRPVEYPVIAFEINERGSGHVARSREDRLALVGV